MIKFKKSEGSMKKAKIVRIFALIALAVAGISGVKNTSAASTINPESGSKIAVRQEIRSLASESISGTFSYRITETDGLNAVSNLPSTSVVLDNEAFVDNLIEKSFNIDLSNVRVIAEPGEYKLKLTCSSTAEFFQCDSSYYTFSIVVENVIDGNQVPTGEHTAHIIGLHKVVNGREIATKTNEAYFYAEEELPPEPVYSYIALKNTTEGNLASDDDVFKYVITVDGSEDDVYTIISPAGKYKFGGEEVESDTEIHGGGTAIIYLKNGESATIGLSEEGEKQILVGLSYSYIEYPDVKDYKTWIDDKDLGERVVITKTVAEDPKSNITLYINSRKKETIPEKVKEFVNTGLKYKNGAYFILGLSALVLIAAIILQRKKKTNK